MFLAWWYLHLTFQFQGGKLYWPQVNSFIWLGWRAFPPQGLPVFSSPNRFSQEQGRPDQNFFWERLIGGQIFCSGTLFVLRATLWLRLLCFNLGKRGKPPPPQRNWFRWSLLFPHVFVFFGKVYVLCQLKKGRIPFMAFIFEKALFEKKLFSF